MSGDVQNPDYRVSIVLTPQDGGEPVDVTPLVAVAYDLVMTLDGLDNGSGFFSTEEKEQIAYLGRLCQFEQLPECGSEFRHEDYYRGTKCEESMLHEPPHHAMALHRSLDRPPGLDRVEW